MKTERFAIIYFDAAGVSFVEHGLTPRESAIVTEAAADAHEKLKTYRDDQFLTLSVQLPAEKPCGIVFVGALNDRDKQMAARLLQEYGEDVIDQLCFCGHHMELQ